MGAIACRFPHLASPTHQSAERAMARRAGDGLFGRHTLITGATVVSVIVRNSSAARLACHEARGSVAGCRNTAVMHEHPNNSGTWELTHRTRTKSPRTANSSIAIHLDSTDR